MKFTVIEYRTKAKPFSQYAVIPDLFVSDLLGWLTLSEDARIISKTDNKNSTDSPLSDFFPPPNWPNYRTCSDHVRLSELIGSAR